MPNPPRKHREVTLFTLLPNIMTVAAICAGLTAIRFGFQGNYERAVQLILVACVLDGLDGHLARLLKTNSDIGAELDSLADFVNFGVAPPLVMYFWALQEIPSEGWVAVLIYAICCVVRLARFNVANKTEKQIDTKGYFIGIPAPAGALLVMFPMFLTFAFVKFTILPPFLVALYIIAIGLLMISRIPTWSFKAAKISRENVKFVLVGMAFFGAAVLTYAWATLLMLCLVYVVIVVWAIVTGRAPKY